MTEHDFHDIFSIKLFLENYLVEIYSVFIVINIVNINKHAIFNDRSWIMNVDFYQEFVNALILYS